MADYPPELITFLMEKHGGEAQVLKDFAHEKIRKNISDLADAGGSLSDLLQEASDQGFREALEKIELKELARLITGKQLLPAISSASGQAQHKRLRLSDAERAQLHEQMLAVEDAITAEQAQLLGQDDYMGHAFRYAELGPWLENLTGGRATLVRIDLASIYGWVE